LSIHAVLHASLHCPLTETSILVLKLA